MAETLQSLADLKGSASATPDAPRHVQKLDKQGRAYATGKRKDAVARFWIKPGKGTITVNGRALEVYFARPVLRMILQQPFGIASRVGQYDVTVDVAGGGLAAIFLTLDHAAIAGEEASLFQDATQLWLIISKCLRETVTNRTGLARLTATYYVN